MTDRATKVVGKDRQDFFKKPYKDKTVKSLWTYDEKTENRFVTGKFEGKKENICKKQFKCDRKWKTNSQTRNSSKNTEWRSMSLSNKTTFDDDDNLTLVFITFLWAFRSIEGAENVIKCKTSSNCRWCLLFLYFTKQDLELIIRTQTHCHIWKKWPFKLQSMNCVYCFQTWHKIMIYKTNDCLFV